MQPTTRELMHEILLRIIVGGVVVSAFAALGELVKPKSFAGLFGAAPSVALATLGLAIIEHGRAYASMEARSMILGAIAFCVYAAVVSALLLRGKWSAWPVTTVSLIVWFACAFGLWHGLLS